ncbi:hypothetical protein I3843_07G220100 [Carya illinoinensis]|nr:hypothetical protein I3843_07G220100 [Carya illinoinensis]
MGSFNFKTMSTGSAVAVASMVTPFVPSRGSHNVSKSSIGAWLILRPEDSAWNQWGSVTTPGDLPGTTPRHDPLRVRTVTWLVCLHALAQTMTRSGRAWRLLTARRPCVQACACP